MDHECSNISGLLIEVSSDKPLENQRRNGNVDEDLDSFECDETIDPNEDEKDPYYMLFLKHLTASGNSYVLRGQRSCPPLVIEYEPELDYKRLSGEKRHDRTHVKREHDFPKWELGEEKKSPRVERTRSSSGGEILPECSYESFLRGARVVDGRMVYQCRTETVMYELEDGTSYDDDEDAENDDDDDDWRDEVEILDAALIKKGNSSCITPNFRRELTTLLRKSFDKNEYDKLWADVELCKPGNRHIELRYGRERSHSIDKPGKSYLDRHPYLRRQLEKFHDDEPKSLNLLRGFFFWLEKSAQEESFQPWLDAECLAISPASG